MNVPAQLTLPAIQDFARDVYGILNGILTQNMNLNGRRVTNAGIAIEPFDYTTKFELDRAVSQMQAKTKGDTEVVMGLLNAAKTIRYGVFASRGSASLHSGELFFASDHDNIGWLSTGAAWIYVTGTRSLVQADLAAFGPILTTDDAGCLVEITDYAHLLKYNGTAFGWGPGEEGTNYIRITDVPPAGFPAAAWQICDGSTVDVLDSSGVLVGVTVPDFSSGVYLKAGAMPLGINPPTGTTDSTTATSNTALTGITMNAHAVKEIATVASGSGDFIFDFSTDAGHVVNDIGHTHTQNGHTHGPGTIELNRAEMVGYFRR